MNNDVIVSSLTNKNIIRWNGSNWVNVADLTNAETNISNLQVSSGILVNTTNTAQNATIVTSFMTQVLVIQQLLICILLII